MKGKLRPKIVAAMLGGLLIGAAHANIPDVPDEL